MADIHVNDIGTMFKLTVKDQNSNIVTLDGSYMLAVNFLLPDGSTLSRTASLYSDGSDGIIQYITTSGDLTQPGSWKQQAVVTKTGGGGTITQQWHSNSVKFKVVANLE